MSSAFSCALFLTIRSPARRQPVMVGGILRKGSPQEQWRRGRDDRRRSCVHGWLERSGAGDDRAWPGIAGGNRRARGSTRAGTPVYGSLTSMLALVYFGGFATTDAIFRGLNSQGTGIISRKLTDVLRRAAAPLYGLAVVAVLTIFPTLAAAQGSDTVYDEARALTGPEEQRVQQAFGSAQQETGQPLYAFLVPNKGVDGQEARQDLLTKEATEAQVPQDAGVVVVATNDGWGTTYNFSQDAYNTMVPDFREGDFGAGLVAGAREIQGEPAAQDAQDNPDAGTGGFGVGGLLLLLAALA